MIVNYLNKTYEPVKVADIEYSARVENIFVVDPNEGSTFEEVKKLPNKVLVWCGSRSSNILRHLHKGFLPTICSLPAPGYMFDPGIVCSDAAAEAARYGFTTVDRPEGFLILAVFSLGEELIEMKSPPEVAQDLQRSDAPMYRLEAIDFGRRMAVEKEIKKTETAPQPNVVFDKSSNFLIYATLLGIKEEMRRIFLLLLD